MPISWFDLFFFIVVALFELHWYRKGRRDDQEFAAFKKEVFDQLMEIGQRLEIAIEKPEDLKLVKNWYFCPMCEQEYQAATDSPCPNCPIIRVEALK
jgi:hypothetical protein